MHERVEAEAPEASETALVPALRHGPVVERLLALQRTAGNAAVTRLLARQETGEIKWDPSLLPPESVSAEMRPLQFVFILGAQDDATLESAKQHYRSPLMTSPTRKVLVREDMSDPTLAGVFAYLSQIKYPIAEISLVVHGSGSGILQVPLNKDDKDKQTTPDELAQALREGVLKPLSDGQITDTTRIRLQACFAGNRSRMVNLLDRAFGEGAGAVIAPTVEVGYQKNIWHGEGITGWWVSSPAQLTTEELALALKTKYAAALKGLDLGEYQEDTGDHHKGEAFKSDDEMWLELARKAKPHPPEGTGDDAQWVYVADAYTQNVKPGYEDDPVLYTKSVYYSPKEI